MDHGSDYTHRRMEISIHRSFFGCLFDEAEWTIKKDHARDIFTLKARVTKNGMDTVIEDEYPLSRLRRLLKMQVLPTFFVCNVYPPAGVSRIVVSKDIPPARLEALHNWILCQLNAVDLCIPPVSFPPV